MNPVPPDSVPPDSVPPDSVPHGRPEPAQPRLQPLVRARLRALGAPGRQWQETLPARLARLAERWQLRLGRVLPGGSNSYVCRVFRADGTDAVLKVVLPTEDVGPQAEMLRAAAGRGYVTLLDADPDDGALLLESLGPALTTAGLPIEDQLVRMADILRTAWLPADAVPSLRGRATKAADLAEGIRTYWGQLGRPCPERVVGSALAHADWLAGHPAPEPVLVHGDPHPQNALRVPSGRPGAETGYVFVDPSSFLEDRCYDLGVTIRDYAAAVLAADRPNELVEGWARSLAARTGQDADRIRRWAFVERVSTGLYVLSFGADRVARPFLDSAARLL